MVAAFPVLKLGALALRQISKPIVSSFKNGAKNSHIFRNYVCLPIAQTYHWADTTIKMFLLGLGRPKSVAPLNEQMAVDLGAEILGETLTFTIAAVTVAYEVNRSSEKSAEEKRELNDRLLQLERRVEFLTFENEKQSAQIREALHSSAFASSPLGKLRRSLSAAPVAAPTAAQGGAGPELPSPASAPTTASSRAEAVGEMVEEMLDWLEDEVLDEINFDIFD